ncbi:MAG: PIN domain-containing protein [Actinobacteria bacterium]|nr:PIN domain-containing protein [Actinomycetota bacterium]
MLDTGPIVALLDADDPEHAACVAMVEEVNEDLVIPVPVLVEVDYWLRKLFGGQTWQAFVEDVAGGAYRLHHIDEDQLVRASQLEAQYDSLSLGFVDAAVVTTCERLGETKVATLDRRHFAIVRPSHCAALWLLPDD